jgi:hypothetical protein
MKICMLLPSALISKNRCIVGVSVVCCFNDDSGPMYEIVLTVFAPVHSDFVDFDSIINIYNDPGDLGQS